MKNAITITRKANTLYAPYLPFAAHKALVQLAKDHNGEIVVNADHTTRIDFADATTAKNVREKWTAEYNANKKPTVAPTKNAPTPAKGKAKADIYTVDGKEYTLKATSDGFVLMPVVPTAPAKKTAPAKGSKKPTAKKADKPNAPKRAKGGFDFGSIKGETNKDKNKALHATLVGMGLKDSRTPEYMSIWNARPWAN